MPRYAAICARWERVPPLSVTASIIAQSLGAMKAPAPKKAGGGGVKEAADAVSNRQSLIDLLGGVGFATEKPEWLRTGTP